MSPFSYWFKFIRTSSAVFDLVCLTYIKTASWCLIGQHLTSVFDLCQGSLALIRPLVLRVLQCGCGAKTEGILKFDAVFKLCQCSCIFGTTIIVVQTLEFIIYLLTSHYYYKYSICMTFCCNF